MDNIQIYVDGFYRSMYNNNYNTAAVMLSLMIKHSDDLELLASVLSDVILNTDDYKVLARAQGN